MSYLLKKTILENFNVPGKNPINLVYVLAINFILLIYYQFFGNLDYCVKISNLNMFMFPSSDEVEEGNFILSTWKE